MARAHHFTRKQRREMEARAKGCCEKCGAVLKTSEGDADHIIPVELGGESTLENGNWLCRPCHKAKTALDIKAIRKSDRARDKESGAIKPKGEIQNRGFTPTRKAEERREKASRKIEPPPRRQLYRSA